MRKLTFIVVALSIFLAPSQPTAQPLPLNELLSTYYSDYFVTVVGTAYSDCDGYIYYDGTQSGAYLTNEKWNCSTGQYVKKCYQNVGGSYQLIACP